MTEKEAHISNTPDLLEFPVLQDIVKSALQSCADDENKNNNRRTERNDEQDEDDDECYTIKVKPARRSTYSGNLFRKPSRLPSIQEESFSSISSKISQAEGEMVKRGQRGFARTKSLSTCSPDHTANGFASDKSLTSFNHNNNNSNSNHPFRRKSVLHTLFGEAGDRRFSQDLRPDEDSITSGTLDVESTDKPVFESVETTRVIFYQVFIPFLIAGFDNVGAGVILDRVQHWPVFKHVPELFILVASFLGLKGNLEMTLAARLATMANMGELDEPKNRMRIASGNIALVQGQAIVVAFLATLIAIVVNYFKEPDFDMEDSLLLCVTGLTTASITGLAMASLMVLATVIARRIGVNPDNVSALIASIMGDISAISLLAFSANTFYEIKHLIAIIGPIIIVFYLILLPACLIAARRNPYVKHVVGSGWMPIIVAMLISSAAGFVFDIAVGFFETIAVIQPIVNGVGGNLIAVQASRISTYFHLRYPIGSLPESETGSPCCQTPVAAFRGKREYTLMNKSEPGHQPRSHE
jgi:solute carrier family 41